ncbi:MAG: recombinase family protein [Acidobacteriota bacterium]
MLIGYARISTGEQKLDLQLDALKAVGCEKLYHDVASGAKSQQTGLNEALAFARAGDVLIVWKLDRLGRSLQHLLETVTGLEKQGIGFRSLQENIDTTTAGGKLIFHVFGALAEFERGIIRERTNAGLRAARERGKRGGRRPAMDARKIAMARALLADPAQKIADICAMLKVSKSTLYKYIKHTRA